MQDRQCVVAVESLEVWVVEDIESICTQLEGKLFHFDQLECFLQGNVEPVERRSSSSISFDVAIEKLKINDVSRKAVHGT